ncbi:serine hydrolase domain-containing protein [Lysinimonas soli]|uniref:Serine hydrolase domain-containing protein n=1 Tax=Lysinimonas soli TaxID=1074233 RepID=A0ABW0NTS8_9MICO
MSVEIDGASEAGWEPVRDAFARAFQTHPRMGGALAIRHRGRTVVDLWGGLADARTDEPWRRDTLSVVFSSTKGLMSLLVALLVQEGRLDYEELVTAYWPEYGQAGKSRSRVKHLLAHRAGLSAPRQAMSLEDILQWDRAIANLVAEEPLWAPGEGWAYHAITHGWLAGELIRRVTGTSVGDYLRSALADLAPDTWIGLPSTEQHRVAHLSVGPTLRELTTKQLREQSDPDWPLRAMTLGGALPLDLVTDAPGFNDPRLQAAQIPGAGGIATARDLAAIWSATVSETSGRRLLGPDVLGAALVEQSAGAPVFPVPGPWPRWAMGFQLDSEARRYLTAQSFGHDGAGGQVAFADPTHEIGFAFVTNWMEADDPRATRIIDAVRDCVSELAAN